MAYAAPSPREMFSDAASKAEVAQRFESYKEELNKSANKAQNAGDGFIPGVGIVKGARGAEKLAERVNNIEKTLSADQLASVQGELEALKAAVGPDLQKDWTLTNPNSTGLVPYDLEAPAKLLVPRLTPLRNSVTRTKGVGTARQFKRITGWSNSGVGGVADMSPFMNSNSVSTAFGPVSLRRGAKISYASDNKSAGYVEMGLSDQVNWQAQFAGQGFQDVRQLSQTALLWAHFGGEERALLYGRGSGTGYVGAVSAPVIAVTSDNTSGSIAAGVYKITVTAKAGFGESVVSNEVTVTADATHTNLKVSVTTEPNGANNYNLYVTAAGGGSGTEKFQTNFVGNAFTLNSTPTTTGAVQPSADSSADANGYDGFLTVLTDPNQSGYVQRLNGTLSTTNPGVEFQNAFLSLYQSVKADPDEIFCDASVMKELGDLLKTSSSANYRLTVNPAESNGTHLGSVITGVINEVTLKMVDIEVHPWMPKGASIVRSRTLPVPDSEIAETSQVVSVQDYMAVDWPVIQYTYDQSTYWFGTLVHYAPAWSGAIVGIQ